MPTYEFRCNACGNKFTLMLSISEKENLTCPSCGSPKVEQLFTGCQIKTSGGGCDPPASGFGSRGGG